MSLIQVNGGFKSKFLCSEVEHLKNLSHQGISTQLPIWTLWTSLPSTLLQLPCLEQQVGVLGCHPSCYVFPKCCIFISLHIFIPYLSPKNNAEFGIDDDPMVQLQDSKRHWWLQPLRNRSGQLCSCQHLHLGRSFCWWVVVLVFARLQHRSVRFIYKTALQRGTYHLFLIESSSILLIEEIPNNHPGWP